MPALCEIFDGTVTLPDADVEFCYYTDAVRTGRRLASLQPGGYGCRRGCLSTCECEARAEPLHSIWGGATRKLTAQQSLRPPGIRDLDDLPKYATATGGLHSWIDS